MSVKNGFSRLGPIIIAIIFIAGYWIGFAHWSADFWVSDVTKFITTGIIATAAAAYIGSLESPFISNGLFWLAVLIWVAMFLWMAATGAQGAVDPKSFIGK